MRLIRLVYTDQNDFDQSIKLFRARSSYTIQSTTGGNSLTFRTGVLMCLFGVCNLGPA